jgi:hypothetical protein
LIRLIFKTLNIIGIFYFMNMNFYFKIIMCFFYNSYLLCVIFFYFWKSATYEKNVEKFYSHMTSVFTAFFTLHYFSWKLNSKNIYHKMKNSILIFNNFFLGINSSTKMRWKKFVKNEKLRKGLSIKVFGFCFFLIFSFSIIFIDLLSNKVF